jgi:hypothetical protein
MTTKQLQLTTLACCIAGSIVLVVLPITCIAVGWFGEAATVAREELGPRALLKKYAWFKDAAASIIINLEDASAETASP